MIQALRRWWRSLHRWGVPQPVRPHVQGLRTPRSQLLLRLERCAQPIRWVVGGPSRRQPDTAHQGNPMKTYNIELPAEFRSGNGVSVERATITRGRMEEILVNAIEADRKRRGAEVKAVVDDLRSHASMARWQAHSLSRLLDAVATQGAQKAATLTAAMSNLERMAMRLEDSADYIDTHAPQPAEPVDKSKNLQGSVVDKAEEMQGQPAEPVNVPVDKAGAVGHIFSLVRRLKNGEPVEDQLRQAIRGLAAEPRLDAPAQVGHTRFGEGVPWSTVIGAAQRYHAIENTPTKEQERMKKAAERLKAIQPAEPVKLECPKCGAERSKVPCAGELMNCHFRGEAQSAEPSKQSEVREYLQQTLRTAADEACRLIANSDTPTKFEGIFGHRAEQLDYASAAKVFRSVGANSFAECFERAAQHKAAKCDGDHGGLSCANPEHWNDSSD